MLVLVPNNDPHPSLYWYWCFATQHESPFSSQPQPSTHHPHQTECIILAIMDCTECDSTFLLVFFLSLTISDEGRLLLHASVSSSPALQIHRCSLSAPPQVDIPDHQFKPLTELNLTPIPFRDLTFAGWSVSGLPVRSLRAVGYSPLRTVVNCASNGHSRDRECILCSPRTDKIHEIEGLRHICAFVSYESAPFFACPSRRFHPLIPIL